MGDIEKNRKIIKVLHKLNLNDYKNLSNLLDMCIAIRDDDLELAISEAKFVRKQSSICSRDDVRFSGLYYKSLLFLAPYNFDSFCLYIEKDRPAVKRFYLPRRKVLKVLADDLQDLADGVIYYLGISLPPRVGKSTLCIFFMAWLMGRFPDECSAMAGHSDKLTKGFYQEALSIVNDPATYLWNEVFPNAKLAANNQQDETIDLNKKKRYPTLTCRSVLGTWTGAIDITKCLYCDDLVEDLEEALNIDRLDKKYDAYLNQLRDRMKDGAFELMVGTRWSVVDPIGRIKAQYEDDPRYRFRVIPALNEKDESNFQYDYGVGFSTEMYHKIRNDIDDATWWAKYMGQPYVREGLLFPKSELIYYNGVLPEREPDSTIAACDVAFGGGDSVSSPISKNYGNETYIPAVVFNKGDKTVTQPLIVGKYMANCVQSSRFEANNGGDAYAEQVDDQLRDHGYNMNITSMKASNQSSKMAKIIQYAPDIKNFIFLEEKHWDEDYRKFMTELTMTVVDPKGNKHDDAADSLRMLAELLAGGFYAKCEAVQRPF